jgi:hypothetical protein
MKIDFSAPITDLVGAPLGDLTLNKMAVDALMAPFEDERHLSGEQKVGRFKLAQRIHTGGEVDLTAEEVSLVKAQIAKLYAILPCARAWELLDPSV